MKRIVKITITCLGLILMLPGCDDKLVEEPRSLLVPGFFSSVQGFESGLHAAYAGNRMLWGNQDLFTITVIGTDEFSSGQDAGGNININSYTSLYQPNNGQVTAIWRNCYTYINTCNGLIDNAPQLSGIDDTRKKNMVAEAKFLRANYYFVLIQFYGDVTLNKNFQTVPTTAAVRHSQAEVYDFIIQDLEEAIADLPPSPKDVLQGQASGATAKHLLSKVYLTRAWSPASKPGDFAKAYEVAKDLIDNSASLGLGLLNDYDEIHNEGNEGNKEVLWTVQHTKTLTHNGSAAQNSSGPDNVLNHMWVPQYEQFPGMQRSMEYGRPYIRCIPTRWITDTVFAERVNDTRYHKTFQTAWLANRESSIPKWPNPLPAGAPADAVPGQPKFALGDTAIYMPGYNVTNAEIAASRYLIIPPRNYTKRLSPAMNKYFDTQRAHFNNPSIRPVIVYRLGETYLIAAEALLMDGRPGDAVEYLNIIRKRAAFPTGDPLEMEIEVSDVSLDFILDERTRELCGENMRWWDLRRTGKLLERVKKHNTEASPNIQAPMHLLRPIPQVQIDGVLTGDPYPQNPGW